MLKQLYIRNYALFAESQIQLSPGLIILTGETGAGKSLLVGALGLIMGKRADSSVVFLADEKCIVEARFGELSPSMQARLQSFEDFDLDEDEVILRREIRPNGKSRAFVNDTPVSLQVLRQVANQLVDLHGQHENQGLLAADKQLELLDAYAGLGTEQQAFAQQLGACQKLRKEIQTLEKQEAQAQEELAYLRHQAEDLLKADLKAAEEAQLEEELNLLQHAEEVREAVGGAADVLYHADLSLYEQLSEMMEPLKKVREVSSQLGEEYEKLLEMAEQMKGAAFSFQEMLETTESDPERLAFIEERLAIYHQLKLRYKAKSGAELVALLAEVEEKIEEFGSLESRIESSRQTFRISIAELERLGRLLEEKRQAACGPLGDRIESLLQEVGFQRAQFEVALSRTHHPDGMMELDGQSVRPSLTGFNQVQYMIRTNPGMPAGSLAQIASGGEISRVMLALKAALAEKFDFPVLIFDEIDTGISGEIAHKVGVVMQQLAKRFQILSITHLPQIAAKGTHHFEIRKEINQDQTRSSVHPLDQPARVRVLAQMISGDHPTDSALRNAEELMRQ